ncbi:hypothetical protein BJ742DRAFT_870195 [Cladochytrium replicatum]|nr:hypothetical protein BJ742DRAFT_870195 [Cladochytrium replicatum]
MISFVIFAILFCNLAQSIPTDDRSTDITLNVTGRTDWGGGGGSCDRPCPYGYTCRYAPAYDPDYCPYCARRPFPYCVKKQRYCDECLPLGCTKRCSYGKYCVFKDSCASCTSKQSCYSPPSWGNPTPSCPRCYDLPINVRCDYGYRPKLIDNSCKRSCQSRYDDPCDACRYWTCERSYYDDRRGKSGGGDSGGSGDDSSASKESPQPGPPPEQSPSPP